MENTCTIRVDIANSHCKMQRKYQSPVSSPPSAMCSTCTIRVDIDFVTCTLSERAALVTGANLPVIEIHGNENHAKDTASI